MSKQKQWHVTAPRRVIEPNPISVEEIEISEFRWKEKPYLVL
jgi:hypothetical protein